MSMIGRKPDEVPRGYALSEACSYLRRSQQEFAKAGLLRQLKKTHPTARKNPFQALEPVERLEINLFRQAGPVAGKLAQADAPWLHAREPGYSNAPDCPCSACDGMALADPSTPADERAAQAHSNSWPRRLCGFVELNDKTGAKKPPHRWPGDALLEKII